MTDADGENAETRVWVKFAFDCQYIDQELCDSLMAQSYEVGRLIGNMIQNPGQFGIQMP